MNNGYLLVKNYIDELSLRPGYVMKDGTIKLNPTFNDIKYHWKLMDKDVVLDKHVATPFERCILINDFCKKNNISHFNVCIISSYDTIISAKIYPFVFKHNGFYPLCNIIPFTANSNIDAIEHMVFRMTSLSIDKNWKYTIGGILDTKCLQANKRYVDIIASIIARLSCRIELNKNNMNKNKINEIKKYSIIV